MKIESDRKIIEEFYVLNENKFDVLFSIMDCSCLKNTEILCIVKLHSQIYYDIKSGVF
jgi:hypothetical protein